MDSLQWSSPDAISRVAALDASVVKVLQSVTSVKGIMSTQTRAHLRRVRSTDLASFVDSVPSAHGYTVGEFASKAAACIFQAQSLIVAAVGKAEASVKDAVAEALKCYAPNSVAWEVASSAANMYETI